jgi:RNA polymerase sigma factor (sigma-70 family)
LEGALSDRSSLKLAVCGNSVAVDSLTEKLRPRIERMAAYYARCSGLESDDLRQEAWIGVLEALPTLDLAIGQPEQYLICCARWRLLDALRRAKLRRCESLDVDLHDAGSTGLHTAPVGGCCREPGHDAALASLSLVQFLGQLDNTQQRVVCCLMDGLTWRETATELGCSSPNIAYHVRRVRERYRAWTGDDYADAE